MNTIDSLTQQSVDNQGMLDIHQIIEIIKDVAPGELNSMLIDENVIPKRFDYCYIDARAQKVSYRTEQKSCASDDLIELQIRNFVGNGSDNPYVKLPEKSFERSIEEAPKFNMEGFFGNARRKMSELVSGGKEVDHSLIELDFEGNNLKEEQPIFLIKGACRIEDCPQCGGLMYIEETDKNGITTRTECSACKGRGHVATVGYLIPKVSVKEISMVRALPSEIENLKESVIAGHKGEDTTRCRMLEHVNGKEYEYYDTYISPYLDMLHDKLGEGNSIEDIYYRIIPCFSFQYRQVLTNEIRAGILIDPFEKPELVLHLSSTSSKLATGIKDSFKGIGKFIGNVSRSKGAKERTDLLHSIRLMIAITVADGHVSEEEKKSLILTMPGVETFSSSEQQTFIELLGEKDSSFLTEEDYVFHNKEIAQTTLARIQDIATAGGQITEEERSIIEKLRLAI